MNNPTQHTPLLLWPFKLLMDLIEGSDQADRAAGGRYHWPGHNDRRHCADGPGHYCPTWHCHDHLWFPVCWFEEFFNPTLINL